MGVLTFSAIQFWGLIASLSLPELPLSVPAWYLGLRNFIWGAVALVVAIGLFVGQSWALKGLRWGGVAGVVWFGADRLFWARSDYMRRVLPFSLILSTLLLVAIFWVISRPSVRDFFLENAHE